MIKIRKTLPVCIALGVTYLISISRAQAAPITLVLLPQSSISGPPGSTIGWGYRITNTSLNWVETLNVTSDIFSNGTPNSIFDFPVIGPNSSVTEQFSSTVTGACPSPDCGLFEFTCNNNAPVGAANTGTFTISSEYFGTNPLTDPHAIDLGPAPDATATYSVSVSGVPEGPTRLVTLGSAILLASLMRRPYAGRQGRRSG